MGKEFAVLNENSDPQHAHTCLVELIVAIIPAPWVNGEIGRLIGHPI